MDQIFIFYNALKFNIFHDQKIPVHIRNGEFYHPDPT